jgi:hypothetical protein
MRATIKGPRGATMQGPLNAGRIDAEIAPPTVGSIFWPSCAHAHPAGSVTP